MLYQIRASQVFAAANKNDLFASTCFDFFFLVFFFSVAESVVYLPLQRRPKLLLFS